MKKVMGLVLALLLSGSMGLAGAAELEGKIQTMDASERVIVLDDGTKLWLAEGLSIESLKEGAKVKLSYEERDGKNVVTSLEAAD